MPSPINIDKYVKTAKDLGYSEEVIQSLYLAKTDTEAIRIMKTARSLELKKSDKVNDERIKHSKPKSKSKVVRNKKDHPDISRLTCPHCGKRTEHDYYIINTARVKDGFPYFAKFQTIWCDECYKKVFDFVSKGQQ